VAGIGKDRRLDQDSLGERKTSEAQGLTQAELQEHHGNVGHFASRIRVKRQERLVHHAVTIVATGGQQSRDGRYQLGKNKRVITAQDLEDVIAHRPEEIEALKQLVIIQCVRQPGEIEYCSRVCCTNTMKNAIRVKQLNPNCQVIVLYKDIITYCFREQYYTEARKRGVLFIRYTDETKPAVESLPDEHVQVKVYEPNLPREMTFAPDLVALSMAIVPSEGTADLADKLHVELSPEGFFQEAHLKMRPMDLPVEGVFVAGMAHYPKFIEETISNAQAAAGRALTFLGKDQVYFGGTIAVVDQDKCVGCLTCTRTCPFGIPQIRPTAIGNGGILGAAYIDPARCQGCGTCTGECPATAIQLVNYRDEQIMLPENAGLGAWVPQMASGG
jgi:heterodisulfide reductase subunit A